MEGGHDCFVHSQSPVHHIVTKDENRGVRVEPRLRDWWAVSTPGAIGFEDSLNFIADLAKDSQDFLVASNRMSRVNKAPVMAVHLSGKHRANLIGVATDGDNGFDFPVQELVQML